MINEQFQNLLQNIHYDDTLHFLTDSDDEITGSESDDDNQQCCLKGNEIKTQAQAFLFQVPPFDTMIPYNNMSLLFIALKNQHFKSVRRLILAGESIQSLLEESIVRCDMECIKRSVQLGAQVADYLLPYAIHVDSNVAIKWLISAGTNVNTISPDGRSMLEIALFKNNKTAVADLIKEGANVNARALHSHSKNTPIIVAAFQNNPDIMDLLIKSGADVNYVNKLGATALIIATQWSEQTTVEMLIKAGANVNVTDFENDTPLSIASRHKADYHIAEVLINTGANVNNKNDSNETPLDLAIKYNHNKTALLLIYAGAYIKNIDLNENPKLQAAIQVYQKLKLNLKHLCRETIRKCILENHTGCSLLQIVDTLALPNLIKEYIIDQERLCDV